jgi:SAM-dependent methyltransferase
VRHAHCRGAKAVDAMLTLDDVTYEMFGIDPRAFYATKFAGAGQPPFRAMQLPAAYRRALAFAKFTALTEAIARQPLCFSKGYKVLDIGCGSGCFGAWVREQLPFCELHGIDMSEACIQSSRENGYSELLCHDFSLELLPYADASFDFVYSMDVFGHIEFRHKDRVIAELARVTKPGGAGFHGIEAGTVDYLNAVTWNPDDPIRRYINIDGHIGVEDVDALYARFARSFEVTAAHSWLMPPVIDLAQILTGDLYSADFARDLKPYDSFDARVLTDAVLCEVNARQLKALMRAFGPILTRERVCAKVPAGPAREYVLSLLAWGGFAMIAIRRAS